MEEISISKHDDEGIFDMNNDDNDSMCDVEIKSVKSSQSQGKKNRILRKLHQKPKAIPQPKKPPPNQFANFSDTTFEAFSNPQKRFPPKEEDDIHLDQSDESEQNPSEMNFDEDEGGEGFGEPNYGNDTEDADELKPSPGFQTIEDEKQDLIYRFHRLEKKGHKLSKKFNVYSDVREMRTEYNKIKKDAEMTSGVKFSKRMLMAVVSGMEFLNKRYDPLGVELNGWSENVMENMNDGDFDNVLERLHDKYSGRMNAPPEMELMLSLAGSAIMFHMTSTMFKSVGPSISELVKQNPNMMQDIMKNMSNENNKQPTKQSENQNPTRTQLDQNNEGGRRTMKGPSMDLSSFGGMFGPPNPISTSSDRAPPHMQQSQDFMMQGLGADIDIDDVPIDVSNSPVPSLASEPISVSQSEIKEVSLKSVPTSTRSRRRKNKQSMNELDLDLDI